MAWPCGSDGLPSEVAALCRTAHDWYEFSGFVIDLLQADEPVRFSPSERNAVERFVAVSRVYQDLARALEAGWAECFPEAHDAAHAL